MNITEALQGVRLLAVDTAPFIYYVEDHPNYAAKIDAVFALIENGSVELQTSVLTLAETLVKPIQAGDAKLENEYRQLLSSTDHVTLQPVTSAIADRTASLRATYKLKTPDAIHLASAIENRCEAFLTNDLSLRVVAGIRIIVLEELELSP